jgi:hypothetical protein
MMLAQLAQQQTAPWPFSEITLDPAQTRGLAWLLILIVGAVVALASGPGRLLRAAAKKAGGALHKFQRALVKILVEIGALVGYHGKRLIFFFAYLALTLFAAWVLGPGVGMKFVVLGLFIAWTSPHRRRMRQSKALYGIDKRLDVLERQFLDRLDAWGTTVARRVRAVGTSRPAQPAAAPAPAPAPPPPTGLYNWQQPPGGQPPMYAPSPTRPPTTVTSPTARRRARHGGYRAPTGTGRP